ncbi:MAG TPA: efflux RND transporter permease subunit [Puia sp.]
MNIVQASLKYRQVTLAVLAIVFLAGVYSLFNMPRREDPKITVRQGLVLAFYPGANSVQVEEQLTKKLEQYLFQYKEVKKEKTHSTTRDGGVVIYVELQDWVKNPDMFWSKLNHELNYAKVVDLPTGVQGPIVDSDFGDTIAMLIGIESDSLDYSQLKGYLEKLEDGLRRVKSVSKIKRLGEQTEQITITTSSEKMSQYGIKLPQVTRLLQSQNAIQATGDIKLQQSDVPLYTGGYYNTLEQVSQQVVGTSTRGNIVRFGDLADVKRGFAEPSVVVTHDQHRTLMLSLEMQEGNNVVKFGESVNQELAELAVHLPAPIKISTIVNQPKLVKSSISNFIREFFLSIISVIIVTILLLPFRVASVAAMAIPVTIAVTFGLLNIFGIELQQVSLAALIVVLGMVVDDAIVIADNYVELLDEGMDRWTAAWRSASDLMVPVLTATATIVASFLPLIIISGSVGEFIFSLPVTVAIALASSFLVAMLLTPMLCYAFIKKGLKDHSVPVANQPVKKKRRSMLDLLQAIYDVAIGWCMRHKIITISASVLSVVAALVLFGHLRQRFFPAAERNQFVIEYWMPTGSRLEKTQETLHKLEGLIKNDNRVADFATFAGTGAPRFYYNFAPQPPVTNYGMILINTFTNEQAEEMATELTKKVDTLAPEGMAFVKLMQQGAPLESPVEVRVIGDDIGTLKSLGARVQQILKSTPGSMLVRSDFHEDYYGLSINLKENANRLGFTTASIADNINTGFAGSPVSVMWEGNQPINLVLRLEEKKRGDFSDITNDYISSPVTGANVPLRQVANLVPEWQTGRVMHRNGVRTLTIQSEAQAGTLPSEVLKKIQPAIAKIHLPAGYRIEYGGEDENQKETFGQMVVALCISIGLIFFILLFQFKNIKESLLIMTSIPLCLFGAILGLVVTNNPFGFTSFLGLISLSGIVVRNSIILVDHTNLLIRQGMDIRTAALESGKRRLRPIFLTAMAAAIGVLPMILSGSSMWSPLASVLAFGVVFSMAMALLVTPLLFVIMVKSKDKELAPSSEPLKNE